MIEAFVEEHGINRDLAAIGYREGDTREREFVRTCQLAKRQDTWFRHQSTPIYVEPTVESVRDCWHTHGPWQVRFWRD